jgi:hypothetical protein
MEYRGRVRKTAVHTKKVFDNVWVPVDAGRDAMMRKTQDTSVTVDSSDSPALADNAATRSFDEIIANWAQAWTNYYQRNATRTGEQRCPQSVEQSNKTDRSASPNKAIIN